MIEIKFNTINNHYEAYCNYRENQIIKDSSKYWKFDRLNKCWYVKVDELNIVKKLLEDLDQRERNRQAEIDRLIDRKIEYYVRFGKII